MWKWLSQLWPTRHEGPSEVGADSTTEKVAEPKAQTPSPNQGTGIRIIGIAPAYDNLTKIMTTWLQELEGIDYQIAGPQVERMTVESAFREASPGLGIFFGHGDFDSLLGPPQQTHLVECAGMQHSRIYDDGTIEAGPEYFFAYCCRAGLNLGAMFGSRGSQRAFMGYRDEIGVDFRPETKDRDVFRSIVLGVVRVMIRDGHISQQHKSMMEKVYDEAISGLKAGIVRSYLREQKKLLCLHGGDSVPNH
jgi:hypothetical protein